MHRWSQTQRVILVVALGAALFVVGQWVNAPRGLTGWTGYAPLQSGPYFSTMGMHPWVRAAVWLILIAVWTTVSLALVAPRSHGDAPS